METSYKRQMSRSFMLVRDEFANRKVCELQMLANNRIPLLLPVEIEISDGRACYWYDITGYQSLGDHLARKPLDLELLTGLLRGLSDLYGNLSEYFLEEGAVLLGLDYVYLDFQGKQAAFSYVPGLEGEAAASLEEFLEELMQKLDHKDKKATAALYEIYQQVMDREKPLSEILGSTLEGQGQPEETGEHEGISEGEELESQPEQRFPREQWEFRQRETSMGAGKLLGGLPWLKKSAKEPEPLAYTPEQEMEVIHPTELLCQSKPQGGRLLYQGQKGFCDWVLEKDSFLIGKKQREVDGYLPEATVSRVHARIQQSEGICYLEDLNSTNGTFLNGERLEYHQKARLAPGDRVAFGTVEYQFECG